LTFSREDLDDACHRIGAVHYARGSANDLDALDVVGRDIREIDSTARLVQRYAVEQHLHVIAFPAA
jgi:hypothetical protein